MKEANKNIRVLLLDNHTLFRRAVARLLSDHPGIEAVGQAVDVGDATKMIRDLAPDVVLLHIFATDINIVDAIPRIKEEAPAARVLVLIVSELEDSLLRAIKNGAHGFLDENLTPEDLFQAIQRAFHGEVVMSPSLLTRLLDVLRHRSPGSNGYLLERLTLRERGVLKMVTEGASYKQVATELGLSHATIRNHVHHIFEKLSVHNRAQAAIYLQRHLSLSPTQSLLKGVI